MTPAVVLRELARGGVTRQARPGEDRGRLQVVAIVPPSAAVTVIEALSESELRELLADVPEDRSAGWVCVECGVTNEPGRRWCRVCSCNDVGAR